MTYHDEIETRAILQGDKQAFEALFRSLYSRLKAFAVRFTETEEDAEDIVQDAFLSLWEKATTADSDQAPIRSVTAYIFQTVRNKALNYVQHHQMVMERITRLEDTEMVESLTALDMNESIEQTTIYSELQSTINRLIAEMPERQREVFLLSREKQLKNSEIAEQLHISLKGVEKHITAALKYLRTNLKDDHLLLLLIFFLPI